MKIMQKPMAITYCPNASQTFILLGKINAFNSHVNKLKKKFRSNEVFITVILNNIPNTFLNKWA